MQTTNRCVILPNGNDSIHVQCNAQAYQLRTLEKMPHPQPLLPVLHSFLRSCMEPAGKSHHRWLSLSLSLSVLALPSRSALHVSVGANLQYTSPPFHASSSHVDPLQGFGTSHTQFEILYTCHASLLQTSYTSGALCVFRNIASLEQKET